MLLNYLKLSFRLLARNPFYSLISIFSLTIGIVSFYFLWTYANNQLRTDQYHINSNRIARIGIKWDWNDGGVWHYSDAGFLKSSLAPIIKSDFPEVEDYVRILQQPLFDHEMVKHTAKVSLSTLGQTADRIFKEDKVVYADDNLFEFFSIPLIVGDPARVLKEPGGIVLSRTTANKYFSQPDPRGELLKLNDSVTLKVTGVFEDLPDNTHLGFEMVISNATHVGKWNNTFLNYTHTYVRLKDGSFKIFEDKLNQYKKKYWGEVLKAYANVRITMFVQPLTEVAFSESYNGDLFPPKSKSFLYTLVFISLSVLFMAWVNHINLSVSRTAKRFKEIAARKVSGANQGDMVKQFMIESTIIYSIALLLALSAIQLVRDAFQTVFNISLTDFAIIPLFDKTLLACIFLFGIVTSGLYPVYSSGYLSPASLFKQSKPSKEKRYYTSVLSILQFSAAIIVIVLGFVVGLQLNKVMVRTSDHDKAIVIVEAPMQKAENYSNLVTAYRNRLIDQANIQLATTCTIVPGDQDVRLLEIKRIGSDHYYGMIQAGADEYTLATFNIKLLAGRNFVKDDRRDVVIISSDAAERLGFTEPREAIGAQVHLTMSDARKRDWQTAEVIGVMDEVEYTNRFKSSVSENSLLGTVFLYTDKMSDQLAAERIAIQINPSKSKEVLAEAERTFAALFPGNVFTWYFHDDHINRVYVNEKIIRNQIILFTSLALIIASIGLLGLISFEVIERKKEVGIRKVLGAKLTQIALLLLRSTGYQVFVSVIISVPFAYFLSMQYIEKFSEQIMLRWWHFGLPILILMAIMFSTIASVLWRAARNNPVDALKHD